MDLDFLLKPGEISPISQHEHARAAGRIFWSDALKGWVASSYDDVRKVISDSARFSSEGLPIAESGSAEAMLVTDSPLHHKIRNVWAKPTSISGVNGAGGDIQDLADQLLKAAAGQLIEGKTVDLVPLFQQFTSDVITFMMDIPRNHSADLQRWNRRMSNSPVIPLEKGSPQYIARDATRHEIYAFLQTEVDERRDRMARGEQPDDMVSLMVAAEGRDGITASISLGNLLNLFLGALDTTVKWLGNIVVALHSRPAVLEELRSDPGQIPKANEEVMRLHTVVQLLLRIVRSDTDLHGQSLKAGDFIYVLASH